ncbi:Rho GTPase-activating protein 9 [Fukomys damarensis]|uniref:Rho GTPase-activating protein 9 n=1 Tax=Fukomys damarensis TaxID=885580 RepID=A0A091D0L6_FUKDA|nr:Rho GTPase-activating protein 9 [Fukomys damarensis]
MSRSVSVASLRPSPLKPLQDRSSRRSLSEEGVLTEASTNMARPQPLMSEPPVYNNLVDLRRCPRSPPSDPACPLLQKLDAWEQHLDPNSGRCFYINSLTGCKSWKPPRRSRTQDKNPGSMEGTQTLNRDINVLQPQAKGLGVDTGTLELLDPQGSPCRDQCSSQLVPSDQPPALQRPRGLPQLLEDPHEVEKSGLLNMTKIAQGGRKLSRRNVLHVSAVLLVPKSHPPRGRALSLQSRSPARPPSLWGASPLNQAFLAPPQIRTVPGHEFLLQSEQESELRAWHRALQEVIQRLDRENPLELRLSGSGPAELAELSAGEDEEEELEPVPKLLLRFSSRRGSSMGRAGEGLAWGAEGSRALPLGLELFYLPPTGRCPEGTEQNRVRNKLKRLIAKRPPLQSLQERGLLRDQVFGCQLESLCQREGNTVPSFVRLCIAAVDKRGLDVDGIYRVSGNLAVVQKLRFLVDREGRLDLDNAEWDDIHVVTGALKLFLRELPQPLVPSQLLPHFRAALEQETSDPAAHALYPGQLVQLMLTDFTSLFP